jgi:hypothetical protein
VLFDRLHHVNRAGGVEAAHRRQQWREKSLVKTERSESDRTRLIRRRFPSNALQAR